MMEKTVSYTKLPLELITKIGEHHIEFESDFKTFGKVCTQCQWRRVMKLSARYAASKHTPWLMVPESYRLNSNSKAQLYKLCNQTTTRPVVLPSLDDDNYWKQMSCSHGWLTFVQETSVLNKDISLLHPFSKERIRIPILRRNTFGKTCTMCIPIRHRKICYFRNPNLSWFNSHYTLGIIFISVCGDVCSAGFWNSRSKEWIVIKNLPHLEKLNDISYYKGEFYVVDSSGRSWMVATNGLDTTVRSVCKQTTWPSENPQTVRVESDGVLLQVFRNYTCFRVWEVN